MKKFLMIIFICIINISYIKAYDITDTFYYDTKVENMYITKVKGNTSKNGAPFLLHKSNGDLVYCLEPFLYMDSNTYYGYKEFNGIFNIKEDTIEKMNLIAHYGYGYKGHSELKWYGVTQYLIWNELGLDDLYFTDSYYGNRIVAYEKEIKDIKDLIDKHYITPSFSDEINIENNKYLAIEDSNGVLSNYKLSSTDDRIKVENNKLILDKLDVGTYKIVFEKIDNKKHYELYYSSTAQNLLLPGKLQDVKKEITINVRKGHIGIRKHDQDTDTPQGDLSFQGAKYGIYNLNDELVSEIILDKLGEFYLDMPFGNYYLKEIEAPIGYVKNEEKYYFNLTFDNNETIIDVSDKVISKNVKLKKYFGNSDTKIYSKESDVTFEIYDKDNNLLGTYKTDSNGEIKLNLIYGKYRIHQVNGLEGYTKTDDYNLEVTDSDDLEISLYDNEIPINVPDTYKEEIDYFGALSVLLILFVFNIGVYVYQKNNTNI